MWAGIIAAINLIPLYRNYFPVFIVTTVRADKMRLFGFLALGAQHDCRRVKPVVSSSFSAP
jgi:hypothetical protein